MTASHHPTPPNGTARHASGAHRPALTTLDEAAHLRALADELSSSQEANAAEAPPSEPPMARDRAIARLDRRLNYVESGLSALIRSQARQLELASAQGASNRSLALLMRLGLGLLAAIGAAAPLLSETVRDNPAALGPYGVVIVAVVAALGRVTRPLREPPDGGGAPPTAHS